MRKRFLLPAFFVCTAGGAQVIRTAPAPFFPVLSAYSTQCSDAFSFCGNTAALAGAQRFAAGMYSEQRFRLKELSEYTVAAVLPTSSGVFGLRGCYAGNASLNETVLGFAYGRRLGSDVAIGAQFYYHGL